MHDFHVLRRFGSDRAHELIHLACTLIYGAPKYIILWCLRTSLMLFHVPGIMTVYLLWMGRSSCYTYVHASDVHMCTSAILICEHLFRETVLEPDPRKFGAIQYMCLSYIGFIVIMCSWLSSNAKMFTQSFSVANNYGSKHIYVHVHVPVYYCMFDLRYRCDGFAVISATKRRTS